MNDRARRYFATATTATMRSALVAQLLLALSAPAFAQQDDSSLDALWNDGTDSSKQTKTKQPSSIDTSPNFKVTTGGASESAASKGASSSTKTGTKQNVDFSTTSEESEASAPASSTGSAPLCTVEAFKGSDFVRSGGWPGIGPFSATLRVPNEMKDAQDNHLRLKVDNQKVTEAELCLVKQPNPASNFINIEMTTDYFLEALGVKPGRISDFNKELEKKKADVVKEEVKPLSLPAGKYQVSIAAPTDEDLNSLPQDKKEKIALVIKVSSRDASPDTIKAHSSVAAPSDTAVDEPSETPTQVAAVPSVTQTPKTPVRAIVKPPVTPVKTAAPTATAPASNSAEALKNNFSELLRTWQSIKKTAVRNRTTGELSEVLAGKALEKQTGAIKYLMTQHKYYDMTSRGVTVNKVQELTPGKKYACFALVKEFRRFIDDTTGKSLKNAEDTYNVNYTIEKIGDKWFISDSVVINAPPAQR